MLVCSCCDSGWHLSCLQPPLAAVPDGDWLCPACDAAAAASGGADGISRDAPVRITVAGQPLAWVQQFKYLGSQFASSGSLDAELSHRTQQAAAAFRRLNAAVWRHRGVQLSTKMRVYRAMVASVLLYGAHSWALSPPQLERLETLQREQLRHILGRSRWQPRKGSSRSQISNEELLALCEQPTIEERLTRLQGRWVGHVLRMAPTRLARQMFFGAMQSPAPQQTPLPYPHTLAARYTSIVHTAFPSHVMRTYPNRDLQIAAANKSEWNERFP